MAKKDNKNIFKLAALVVLAGVSVFLILKLSPAAQPPSIENVKIIAPVSVDSAAFNTPKFKNLRGFGEYPVRSGKTGRQNPFMPPSKQELTGELPVNNGF